MALKERRPDVFRAIYADGFRKLGAPQLATRPLNDPPRLPNADLSPCTAVRLAKPLEPEPGLKPDEIR